MFCLPDSVYFVASFGIFFEGNPFPFTEGFVNFQAHRSLSFSITFVLNQKNSNSLLSKSLPYTKRTKCGARLFEWCSMQIGSATAALLSVHTVYYIILLHTSMKHLTFTCLQVRGHLCVPLQL